MERRQTERVVKWNREKTSDARRREKEWLKMLQVITWHLCVEQVTHAIHLHLQLRWFLLHHCTLDRWNVNWGVKERKKENESKVEHAEEKQEEKKARSRTRKAARMKFHPSLHGHAGRYKKRETKNGHHFKVWQVFFVTRGHRQICYSECNEKKSVVEKRDEWKLIENTFSSDDERFTRYKRISM